MKRPFNLHATFGQEETHDLNVTFAQAKALDNKRHVTPTLAAIIRLNWLIIMKALRGYSYPYPECASMWQDGNRTARIEDKETGEFLNFVATQAGPFFTHEVPHTGLAIKTL